MKNRMKAALILLLAASAIYWAASRGEKDALAETPVAHIELDQSAFTIKQWRNDGSHLAAVKGKLTFGGQPVANAVLRSDAGRRNIRTEEDGSFELRVDRSLLTHAAVRVASVQEAKVAGKPIGKGARDEMMSASAAIKVYHPIEVTRVRPSAKEAGKVEVHARIVSETGDKVSFFQVDKYRIAGQVSDADGRPVKDAIVWIDRDRGEGFAKSTPTDRDGRYEMYYWPEDEETNLTVVVGTRRYTLPEGKVFILPRNTSVDIRIRLPREGTEIDDKPPTLVCLTSKGAMYTGVLAALDVPSDVKYTVTIPDRDGRFVLTVPKDAWERRPSFFETRLTKFLGQEKVLRAGDALPVGFVTPGDRDPRVVPAAY